MRERMQYDPETNILEINFSNLTISSEEQIDAIEKSLNDILGPLGRRVYALVNYEGFQVEDELKEKYGKIIKELYQRYSLGTVRYSSSAFTRVTIKTTSVRQGLESHTYPSREEALAAIDKLKGNKSD